MQQEDRDENGLLSSCLSEARRESSVADPPGLARSTSRDQAALPFVLSDCEAVAASERRCRVAFQGTTLSSVTQLLLRPQVNLMRKCQNPREVRNLSTR